MGESLKVNTTLTELTLHFNETDSRGANSINTALIRNSTLNTLDLTDNRITNGCSFIDMLKVNTTLKKLNIGGNKFDYDQIKLILQSLTENSTLKALSLNHSQISDEISISVADLLRQNSSLTSLELHNNQIGNIGAQAIASSLYENISLTTLTLFENRITTQGQNALEKALQSNITIFRIEFDKVQYSAEKRLDRTTTLRDSKKEKLKEKYKHVLV